MAPTDIPSDEDKQNFNALYNALILSLSSSFAFTPK